MLSSGYHREKYPGERAGNEKLWSRIRTKKIFNGIRLLSWRFRPFCLITVNERHPGIFVITGAIIPIQIIDIRKLSDEENLWLRNLNRNLTEKNLLWAHGMNQKHGLRLDMNAWMQAVFVANHKAIEEIISKEGNRMLTAEFCETIEKIGLGETWRKKGKLEGRREGKLEAAQAMFAEGDSIDKIARVTGISQGTLKKKLSRK